MKFSISTFILLAATLAVANEHKRYIVTYGESTPNRVIEKAMADIKSAVCSQNFFNPSLAHIEL